MATHEGLNLISEKAFMKAILYFVLKAHVLFKRLGRPIYTSAILIRMIMTIKPGTDAHASQSDFSRRLRFVTHNDAEAWLRKVLLLTLFYR